MTRLIAYLPAILSPIVFGFTCTLALLALGFFGPGWQAATIGVMVVVVLVVWRVALRLKDRNREIEP